MLLDACKSQAAIKYEEEMISKGGNDFANSPRQA